MARYKEYSYEQGKFIPVHFDRQILPGTFEYSLSYLIDHEIDLSIFEERYKNDDTGAPAYDPGLIGVGPWKLINIIEDSFKKALNFGAIMTFLVAKRAL